MFCFYWQRLQSNRKLTKISQYNCTLHAKLFYVSKKGRAKYTVGFFLSVANENECEENKAAFRTLIFRERERKKELFKKNVWIDKVNLITACCFKVYFSLVLVAGYNSTSLYFWFLSTFRMGKKAIYETCASIWQLFYGSIFFISSRKRVKRDGKKSTLNNANQIESWKVNKNKCDRRIGQPIYRDRRDDVHISQ